MCIFRNQMNLCADRWLEYATDREFAARQVTDQGLYIRLESTEIDGQDNDERYRQDGNQAEQGIQGYTKKSHVGGPPLLLLKRARANQSRAALEAVQ